MKFTKENVMRLLKTHGGIALEEAIENLDDTPEKVVVPKFVADFYEECENATLEFLITQLEATYSRSELGEWYRSCRGRHRNGRANAQEVIAKMKLYGYEVEKEPLYYVELPEKYDGKSNVMGLKRRSSGNIDIGVYEHWEIGKHDESKFTEKEIKDYDERYWPFAVLAND